MKIEDIYKIVADENGWRLLPNGNHILLGVSAKIRASVQIGNWAQIGYRAQIGDWAEIGDWAKIGARAQIGDLAKIGAGVQIGDWAEIGDSAEIGAGVKIWASVKIGAGAKIGANEKFDKTPVQVQCNPYLVYPYSKTDIGVGCIVHPVDYWMRDADPDELAEHPECKPWSTYREAINLVAKFMPRATPPAQKSTRREENERR